MASTPVDEETQIQSQETEHYHEETQAIEDEMLEQVYAGTEAKEEATVNSKAPKRARLPPKDGDREPGKSQFPFSKVQKIIKADKEIPIVSKEATFLISLATEEFVKRFCQAGRQIAQNERRSTVQYKDLVSVVRKVDEFLFLEDIIQLNISEALVKQPKTKVTASNKPVKTTMLDNFVGLSKVHEKESEEDIIMNDDGTMYAAGHVGED